jgi:DNA-directed RNA polymerase specialized sigma24 family protein
LLSPQQRFTLIMSHLGKSDEEIREMMGLTDAAWRTMQSRMKKKINTDGDF